MTELGQLDIVDVDNLSDDAIRALLKWYVTTLGSASTTFPKRGKRSDPAVRLLSTPASGTTTVVSSIGTPKMDTVFASTSRGEDTTYTSALKFLENSNQVGFNSIFGFPQFPSR